MSLLNEMPAKLTDHFEYENLHYFGCVSHTKNFFFLCSILGQSWNQHKYSKAETSTSKIAPFPISLLVKCLWSVNKSIFLKISPRCSNFFTSTSKDYFFTDNESSLTARGWLACNDFINLLTTSILKQRVSNYKHSTFLSGSSKYFFTKLLAT